MADVSITTAAEPDGAPRIAVLDILRGIAILGILFMNINDMGQSLNASFDDIRHLGWSQTDQIAWWLRQVLANGTARCMLEMLFGAGMVILTDRVAEKVGHWVVMKRYYARNLILFGFGLVHIFILLWPGDILHTYGLAALVAFLFRRLSWKWLLGIGLSLAVLQLVGGGIGTGFGLYAHAEVQRVEAKVAAHQPLDKIDRKVLADRAKRHVMRAKNDRKSAADIALEDKQRSGTFRTWAAAQWGVIIDLESNFLEFAFVWEAASTMLIGAALFKLGVLQGGRSHGFYGRMALIAYLVGIVLRVGSAYAQTRFDHLPSIFYPTSEVARLAMTLGHVGIVNWLVGTVAGARFLRPFVAAGRTALSVYIAQTLICLWVLFPPFMLGLYHTLTWGPLMVTAFVINALLLVGANIWVRHFDIAPVEWAWRSLVEGRVLPWRRGRRSAAMPVGDALPA